MQSRRDPSKTRKSRPAAFPSRAPGPPSRARRLATLLILLALLLAGALWVNGEALVLWYHSRRSPEDLLVASRRRPDDRILVRTAAERLLAAGRAADAREVVVPAAEKHPEDIATGLLAARALWRAGEPDRAGAYFDRILQAAPTNPEVRYWSAEFLYFRGYAEAAEELLKEVVELEPGRGAAWLRLGEIALKDEHYADALALLDRAEKLAPGGEVARVRARALKSLGRLPEAEAAARSAVVREPTAESHAELGDLLQFIGGEDRLREARTHLQRSLALNAGSAETMKLLGVNYRMLGDHAEAVRILRRALRTAPAMSEAYLLLGQSYRALGDAARSRHCLRIYSRLEPLESRVNTALYSANVSRASLPLQLRLARAYLAAGRQDLAREVLERARRKNPEDPEIARLLRQSEGPPTLRIEPLPADPEHDTP